MTEISIKIINEKEGCKAVTRGKTDVNLVYQGEYVPGDTIVIEVMEPMYAWISLDDTLDKSLCYITGNVSYKIPFAEARINLSTKTFYGDRHLISFRRAYEFELSNYYNLACNTCDQHLIENMYPHAVANVETRGEAVFAAQNAIDGVLINASHGEWPYQSWGINRQSDAMIQLDFGREVEINRIILYTRADFPHDNWWKKVSFSFSDDSSIDFSMEKSAQPKELVFEPKKVSWVKMHDMIPSNEPSPFPPLTQMEVWGRNIL